MSTDVQAVLIKSIDFTHSVGKRGEGDETFTDVIKYGGFPIEQKIQKIKQIDVYSDMDDPETGVIVGLKVTYKLKDGTSSPPISHGIVNTSNVDQLFINDHELLVGVYGQLKNLKTSANDGRLATISFVLFDQNKATVVTKGAFPQGAVHLGKVWAHFGHIIALQGTKTDGVGLTSLGFIETVASA